MKKKILFLAVFLMASVVLAEGVLILGDVNGDGLVDKNDINLIAKYIII